MMQVRLVLGAILLVAAHGISWSEEAGASTNGASSNAEAIAGVWALQQVNDMPSLVNVREAIGEALKTPGLTGFSLRAPWKSIDADFHLLDSGKKLADEHKVAFSVRFMAGRHTPGRLFDNGCRYYLTKAKEKVPSPFNEDGSPNVTFEKEYDAFVARLAAWCRANGVRLLHLAWYGQEWAELNHGKEVRALKGYSLGNWQNAHKRLIDIGLKHAGPTLAVEFPFSGHGPCAESAPVFADYVFSKIGAWKPLFFCQANGWGPNGDWGAPNSATEDAFDKVWARPICRGEQMIQPGGYDWGKVFQHLYDNQATYCEIYVPSFTLKNAAQLRAEILKFSQHAKERPLPQ